MNNEDRDDLLVRIDERLKALKDGDEGDIPEIKKHLGKLNGRVSSNKTDCNINKAAIVTLTTLIIIIIGALIKLGGLS